MLKQGNFETQPSGESAGTEQTEHLESRKSFLAKMRNKFMAMALAGFITLGGGWEKGYAEQIRVAKKAKEAPMFLLESAITPEKIKAFEEKLKKEEPEFVEWLSEYSLIVSDRLDDLADKILNYKEDQDFDWFLTVGDGALPESVYKDHEILENIKEQPGKLQDCHRFLKNNIYDIILGVAFLDNSKAVRNNMIKLVNPPDFSFIPHGSNQRAFTSSLPLDRQGQYIKTDNTKKWSPRITFTSQAAYQKDLDFGLYTNVFIHELIHALHPGAENLANPSEQESDLMSILGEGLAQNITLEITQQLNLKDKNKKLKSSVGLIDSDERVVLAAILEGIFRYKKNSDSLSRWHTEIINDSMLADELKPILKELGLDERMARDLKETEPASPFGDLGAVNFEDRKSYRMLIKLLARLKMDGVQLSPAFIESILTKGRTLDDFQVESSRALAKRIDRSVRGH